MRVREPAGPRWRPAMTAGAMAVQNGHMQSTQFSLTNVKVISTTVDIEDVRTHHEKSSCSTQAAGTEHYYRIMVPIALSSGKFDVIEELNWPSAWPYEVRYHAPEEKITCQVRLEEMDGHDAGERSNMSRGITIELLSHSRIHRF